MSQNLRRGVSFRFRFDGAGFVPAPFLYTLATIIGLLGVRAKAKTFKGGSMKQYTVAILGATGAVGTQMLECLNEQEFPVGKLKLLASARSAGKTVEFRGEQIVPATLVETPFDSPLGTGTGTAVIFGSTGGVMEAALRTAFRMITGENPDPDAFSAVGGMEGWKEARFDIPDADTVRVAVVSGLGNTRKLMRALEKGEVSYDFVEVMACPGGCVGGGGQPIHDGVEMAAERGGVLWGLDAGAKVRFSHENPSVQACYHDFLGEPLSELAEELLHTDQSGWKMPGEPA